MWFHMLAAGTTIETLAQVGGEGGGVGASAPVVLVPLGVVTAMLVAIFGLFMKDQARNDQRGDRITAQLVASAESERDRALQMVKELQAELRQLSMDHQQDREAAIKQEREKCQKEIAFWQRRAEDLEKILYQRRTGNSEPPS